VSINDDPFPQTRHVLEWETTSDSACDKPSKRTIHYLTLAIPKPVLYEFEDALNDGPPMSSSLSGIRTEYVTLLTFAWSYVLSVRWIEILRRSGNQVSLRQREIMEDETFWSNISQRQWQATLVRGERIFKLMLPP
jgi:hypothetical protein